MIDTHCHLNLPPLRDEVNSVWSRAQEVGVTRAIVIGTDINTSRDSVEIASTLEGVSASIGIHPDVVKLEHEKDQEIWQEWRDTLEELAASNKVVAIGECGLDYVELQTIGQEDAIKLKNMQKALFGLHIKLAKKHQLPLSIHCRNTRSQKDLPKHDLNAYKDMFDAMEHFCKDDGLLPKFVLHCMSGDIEYLESGLKRGGFISFAGNVTYPTAESLRELLRATPLNRLLLETDAPFLTPQSGRGTTNEPAKISETYSFVGNLLGLSVDKLDETVTANAKNLFTRV